MRYSYSRLYRHIIRYLVMMGRSRDAAVLLADTMMAELGDPHLLED